MKRYAIILNSKNENKTFTVAQGRFKVAYRRKMRKKLQGKKKVMREEKNELKRKENQIQNFYNRLHGGKGGKRQ